MRCVEQSSGLKPMSDKLQSLIFVGGKMRVLKAKINWYDGWANDAKLELLVDKIPSVDEVVHDIVEIENAVNFCGSKDGYVHFCSKVKGNSSGFYGTVFTLNTRNGRVSVAGPWSSRPSFMNKLFPRHTSVDACFTDNEADFDKGYTLYSGAVTLELAEKALTMIHPELKFTLDTSRDEINFTIDKKQKVQLNIK